MRCYYEELGVERDSSEGDIKTAYRKLALRWHPDKNPDRSEEAKEKFQLIQQAYEVLSDSLERTFYDKHREQILRGKNNEYEENCLDVFPYFTISCYKGYGDDAKGFYSVYAAVFRKIAVEDFEFMDERERRYEIPEFGNSESGYDETVGPFYAHWSAYRTRKTYEWLCPYDVTEIKERYILRKVEKEMRKIVQVASKERNEEVRNLVTFVRKRDRRVQAYRRLLEERAEANRLKQQKKRSEQLLKRQQELQAALSQNKVENDGYEEQLQQLEQEYGSDSDYTGDDDEDDDGNDAAGAELDSDPELEYVDELYCVACNKSFKNDNALGNHEESKKHRENVERLRLEMQAEEEAFNDSNEAEEEEEESEDILDECLGELQLNGNHEAGESVEEAVEAPPATATKRDKKSKKKAAKQLIVEDTEEEEPVASHAVQSDTDDDWSKGGGNASRKSGKKSKSKKSTKREPELKTPIVEVEQVKSSSAAIVADEDDDNDEAAAPQHSCVTCHASFDSKNKLFAHLKKTNHGVYIPKEKPVVEGKPAGKSKAKRK